MNAYSNRLVRLWKRAPAMTFGYLSKEQAAAVRLHVEGQHVVDLGAGALVLSERLLRLGASQVTAVDKDDCIYLERVPRPRVTKLTPSLGVSDDTAYPLRFSREEFSTFSPPPDARVAFLSWPAGERPELLALLDKFATVALLSKSTDGLICGWPGLYAHLQTRELLAYVPRRRNTLSIYGSARIARSPSPEEAAGMTGRRDLRYHHLEGTLS